MAEPKPAPHPDAASEPNTEAAPKLVAVSDQTHASEPTRADPEPPRRRGVSRGVFAVVAVLLVLALGGLYLQTQHARAQAAQITALEGQVGDLESRLATATSRLAAYDRTLGDVRGTVSDLFERIAALNAMVQADPLAETQAATEQ